MKTKLVFFLLFAFVLIPELVVLTSGCEPAAASKGTIEVWNQYLCAANNAAIPIYVSLDGGTQANVNEYYNMTDQLYTFPNPVTPGSHTLTFSFDTVSNQQCAPYSYYYNGASVGSSYNLNFTVGAGDIYETTLTGSTGVVTISVP